MQHGDMEKQINDIFKDYFEPQALSKGNIKMFNFKMTEFARHISDQLILMEAGLMAIMTILYDHKIEVDMDTYGALRESIVKDLEKDIEK